MSDKRLPASSYLSVRLQAAIRLSLDGFSSNFILANSTKTCRPNWILVKNLPKSTHILHEDVLKNKLKIKFPSIFFFG
jgi:hypothetical protein